MTHTVAASARWNLALGVLNLFVSLLASIAVARALPTSAFADYATMMAIIAWTLLVTEAGGNVGFSRFLKAAEQQRARGTLYRAVLRRRYSVGVLVVGAFLLAGPLWAGAAGLSQSSWDRSVFLLLALVVVADLQGQLGHYALISSFRHRDALLIAQGSSLLKAVLLIGAAWTMPSLAALAGAVLAGALVAVLGYHSAAKALLAAERAPLPPGMLAATYRHGLVTMFDKVTTAVGGGPFLLIVLAGTYGRPELALLGIASEFMQRALGVANLPVANMMLPYLHRWQDSENVAVSVRRAGSMGLLVLAPGLGAAMTLAPEGLPLLFGDRYAAAAWLVLCAALPTFAEAWCRMILGFTLIAGRQYKAVTLLNAVQGVTAIVVLVLTAPHGLLAVVIGQGIVRLAASLAVLVLAWRKHLVDRTVLPHGLLVATSLATGGALLVQHAVQPMLGHWSAVLAMASYALLLTLGTRLLVQLDRDIWQALSQIGGGRLDILLKLVFRAPRRA